MKRARLSHVITFRLNDEQWSRLENMAQASGENWNDWCRKASLEKLRIANHEGVAMTPIERAIFEEVSRLRFLVGHAFRLVAIDELTESTWETLRKESHENVARIMKQLLPPQSARGLSE